MCAQQLASHFYLVISRKFVSGLLSSYSDVNFEDFLLSVASLPSYSVSASADFKIGIFSRINEINLLLGFPQYFYLAISSYYSFSLLLNFFFLQRVQVSIYLVVPYFQYIDNNISSFRYFKSPKLIFCFIFLVIWVKFSQAQLILVRVFSISSYFCNYLILKSISALISFVVQFQLLKQSSFWVSINWSRLHSNMTHRHSFNLAIVSGSIQFSEIIIISSQISHLKFANMYDHHFDKGIFGQSRISLLFLRSVRKLKWHFLDIQLFYIITNILILFSICLAFFQILFQHFGVKIKRQSNTMQPAMQPAMQPEAIEQHNCCCYQCCCPCCKATQKMVCGWIWCPWGCGGGECCGINCMPCCQCLYPPWKCLKRLFCTKRCLARCSVGLDCLNITGLVIRLAQQSDNQQLTALQLALTAGKALIDCAREDAQVDPDFIPGSASVSSEAALSGRTSNINGSNVGGQSRTQSSMTNNNS